MRANPIFLTLLIPVIAGAQTFLDIGGHPHAPFIEALHEHGIVQGYGAGVFRPDALINRAEFLKITMLAAFGQEVFDLPNGYCFADFVGEEQWYWVYACAAKQRGIVHGYPDGTFRGEQPVNLAEALKIGMQSWQISLPSYLSPPEHWYDPYFDAASFTRVFTAFPRNPGHLLTRSDMAAVISLLDVPIATVTVSEAPAQPSPPPPTAPAQCGNGVLEAGEQCDDGNLVDGDGCSSLCILVPLPVRHGAIVIDQRPTGEVEEAGGARGVRLLVFEAIAGRQDVILTGLKFKAATGSLLNAENYRLYRDADGNGTPEALVATGVSENQILSFSQLGILVEDGRYSRLEVRADLRESTVPSVLGLSFATGQTRYIEAIDALDSRDLTGIETDNAPCMVSNCWIGVHTQSPHVVRIAQRGNLYVTQGTTPVSSRQLLGSSRSKALLRLTFFADEEDIEVEQIRIGGGGSSIDALELTEEVSNAPFAQARVAQCGGSTSSLFCATTSFIIPRSGERRVLVRGLINADTNGAISGDTVALSLTASTAGSVAVEAFGKASQQELSQNDGDTVAEGEIFIGSSSPGSNSAITGPTHDVVFAKIISIENASTDSDDSAVPVGPSTIARFRFAAAPHRNSADGLNAVTLEKIVFTVAANNVAIASGSFALFNVQNTSVTASCTATATTGAITVTCSDLDESAVSTAISQGAILDLALKATITNAQVSTGGSTLQVGITGLSDRTSTGTIEWNDGVTTFGWVDLSEVSVRSTRYRNQ